MMVNEPADGQRGAAAGASPPIVLRLTDVHTRFGDRSIHRGVSLEVARGELVALIGGSGAGKSVLMRAMVGLMQPHAGRVEVLGTDMYTAGGARVALTQRRLGIMYQGGALFSSLDVSGNVAAPLVEQGTVPSDLLAPLVALRLAQAGLDPAVGRQMPSELSGGMVKRAALARALALEPDLLFLDEPTSGLDPITARAFDGLVRFLCDDLGLTVLMITHDLDSLFGIVDRVIVLGDGRVIAQGDLEHVMAVEDEWIAQYFSARRRVPASVEP